MSERWHVGDRVTRHVFMDDGTWAREGDTCLRRSPLRHGTITRIFDKPSRFGGIDHLHRVEFDDGEVMNLFWHGMDAEPGAPAPAPRGRE